MDTSTDSAMVVTDLTKTFRTKRGVVHALDSIDLTVRPQEFISLLGTSGCGKSTLLRIMAGLEEPSSGSVTFGGREVRGPGRDRGMVFQSYTLFPWLNVIDNIAFGLREQGMGRAARRAVAEEYVDLVGLRGFEQHYTTALSGGMQQRVALARALANEPRALLLDEPFGALDAALRADLRAEIRQILREAGTTTVLVTHDQDEALSTADHVVVLRDGRVVQQDTPAELYARPADAWVARFVGDCTILPARSDGTGIECELGRVPVAAPAGPVELVLRPEQVSVSGEVPQPGAGQGVVTGREFFGHDTLYRLRLDTGTDLLSRMPGPAAYDVASRVRVAVQGDVHVL